MRLLFDENLSPRLVGILTSDYPKSSHVELERLRGQPDTAIWECARSHGFVIVSKDNDFRQLSFLHGAPPKVVWLDVGNASTRVVADLLRAEVGTMHLFEADMESSLLVLALPDATSPQRATTAY